MHLPTCTPRQPRLSCQHVPEQLFWWACRVGIHLPSVTIRFRSLTASATAVSAENALPSIWNSYKGFVVVSQGWTYFWSLGLCLACCYRPSSSKISSEYGVLECHLYSPAHAKHWGPLLSADNATCRAGCRRCACSSRTSWRSASSRRSVGKFARGG